MNKYFLMPHPPLIIPEVGHGREAEIQNTIDSCRAVGQEISESEIDTIIIISPHGTVFSDAIALIETETLKGDFGNFGAKDVSFNLKVDMDLTKEIIKQAESSGISAVGLNKNNAKRYGVNIDLDHGAAVPLYFVKNIEKFKIVHITYGMLSPIELYSFGMAVLKACNIMKESVAIIASGDLSHRLTADGPYPYSPYGEKFDHELIELLKKGDFKGLFSLDSTMITEAGECGLRSLYILAGTLDGKGAAADVLSYEGPFGVGYGVARFNYKEGKSIYDDLKDLVRKRHSERLAEGNPYTRLARENIEHYFKTGKALNVAQIQEKDLLNDKKGVFVSLKIKGDLRGCIGTIEPATPSVGEEILNNSLSAALEDPRFSPLREEELFESDISVDLLYPPEKCSFHDLDPLNYGVIVTSGRKRGLLLPNLEGIDSKEQQVSIALQKGGISKNEPYEIERFKVKRFKEVED